MVIVGTILLILILLDRGGLYYSDFVCLGFQI